MQTFLHDLVPANAPLPVVVGADGEGLNGPCMLFGRHWMPWAEAYEQALADAWPSRSSVERHGAPGSDLATMVSLDR